jgi:four helix bundle protein
MHPFDRLTTWRVAHELSLSVYRATRAFPAEERFGLVSQLRRAAVSIEANIAEGAGRRTQADFRRFLDIASGSASELHCHLLLARDLGVLPSQQAGTLVEQAVILRRMINALARKVRNR